MALGWPTAEHDTASEHGGLAVVVRGDIRLGGVDEDALGRRILRAPRRRAALAQGGVGRRRGGRVDV